MYNYYNLHVHVQFIEKKSLNDIYKMSMLVIKCWKIDRTKL